MRICSASIVVALALAGGLLPARWARAQARAESGPALLALAETELRALRYEQAAALLDRAWRAGGNRPADLVLLFRLAGTVAVTLGDDAGADAAFRRLVALDPDHRLPEGTSPKISTRLDAARAALAGRALRVEIAPRAARVPTVAIDVRWDPARMVAGARGVHRDPRRVIQRCPGSAPSVTDADAGAATLLVECAPGIAGAVEIEVLDAHGNVLVEGRASVPVDPGAAGGEASPRVAPGPAELTPGGELGPGAAASPRRPGLSATDETGAAPPFHARPLPWAGAAAGLGAVGLFFGLRSESAQDELDELNRSSASHDFRDALAVEDRLRRDSRIANAAFIAAGAASVVAVVLWIRERRAGRRAEARAALPGGPAPLAGAAGLTWDVRF